MTILDKFKKYPRNVEDDEMAEGREKQERRGFQREKRAYLGYFQKSRNSGFCESEKVYRLMAAREQQFWISI